MIRGKCAHPQMCSTEHRHEHHFDDEYDPCMAQEIAHAEKARVLYEKMKCQSDRLLMNLSIRTNKFRPRAAVTEDEDIQDISSDWEDGQNCERPQNVVKVTPRDFLALCRSAKHAKVFTLAIPCDMTSAEWPESDVKDLEAVLAERSGSQLINKTDVFSAFNKAVCVCGTCEIPEACLTGSLRSISMILRSNPSVILTRNGGLLGIWSAGKVVEARASLSAFITKNS